MENSQDFNPDFDHDFNRGFQHSFQQDPGDAGAGGLYFTVTYLDTDCGRIRSESFDDAAAADRFASRCVVGEDGWAVVDAVQVKERRAAA
ncbi:hypothetical protein [Arthrobacter sp. NicSoilB8]|uniref:hypothetical protein n=1 Tax=Arthrobacter sp. NicSoilB8 TaxID=2830998 RepID=UPI001CC64DB5|nr:hypothetical protein [Arthrobacter sp. NicSoilB8]BCW69676.1 hypothetical protein NicSoilB8_07200 [Arthrobacter sp. NicSoilB8]